LEVLTELQTKLEQKERLNRIFVEQSPIPVAMFNREIKLLAASGAWIKDYGFKQEEILGKSFYLFYDRAEYYWRESFEKALNGEVVSGTSEQFTTESGKDFWLDWEVRPWYINEDEIGGILFSFYDVTEKRALQIQNERYKMDMELSNEAAVIGTWQTDIVNNKVTWSKVTKQIHGVPADFEPNVSIGLLFYKEGKSRETVTKTFQNTLETGEGFDLELQIVTANNETKWIRTIGLTEMKEGKCVRVYGTFQDINERKLQELKIKEESLKMENLLKGTNAGTWEWNVQTGETKFNERWAEIIGYTLEELSPISIDTWVKYSHPDDLEKSNEALQKHFTGQTPYYEIECRMKHKDGSWIWVVDRGKVLSWTEDGKPLIMFGTYIDITRQKKRHVQFENFVKQAPSAVAMFDKNLCCLAASDKWLDEYGFTGEDVYGQSIYDLFPNTSDNWKELHQACLNGEIKKGTETPFINSQGELVWLNWEMKPWKSMGQIAGIMIHSEDVTKARELEAQKDRIQNVLELTNNVVRVGAWEYEIDSDELYWSDVTKEIHEVEYDYKPSLKEAVEFYEDGKHRATMLKALDDAIKKGESYDVELKIITAQGKELWVRAVGKPIFENKKCIKLLGIFMDVDDAYRYNNEEIVVKKNRLQDVNESLIKKNKRLADFAQITSHNLRGPVSNLNSLLNLYETSATKGERDMIVGKVSTVTNYLNDTLNTLVESLAIQETSVIKRKKLFFQDVLDKAIPAFQYVIDDFEINLITDFEKAPSVNYNAVYLESIFQNLISNAIKYRSKKRKLEINIKSYKENKYIYLEISDNGLGIDLNKYGDKIFGLNRTFHRVEGSKGIGLYMTKQQVESMGGSITVRSEVDKGTVFIIQL
jgi:PAS domain S-box-containing protein